MRHTLPRYWHSPWCEDHDVPDTEEHRYHEHEHLGRATASVDMDDPDD